MNKIKVVCFAIACLLLQVVYVQAQEEQPSDTKTTTIVIRHADYFKPGTTGNKNILKGNVHLTQEGVVIYCDSLYQFTDRNYIEAFGRVHVIQNDTMNLWGDFMAYNGDTKKAIVRRNVIMDDGKIVLHTEFLDYNMDDKVGYYFNGGIIKDSTNTLISERGYYYSDEDKFFFKDSVKVYTPDYTLYSDTLIYNTLSKLVTILSPTTIYGENSTLYSEDGWCNTLTSHIELFKNNAMTYNEYKGYADSVIVDSVSGVVYMKKDIHLHDTVNQAIIEGEYGEMHRDNDYAFVTHRALLILINESDSLFVHGDTISSQNDTLENKILKAFYNTKFFSMDLQGLCDSMTYNTADSIVYLNGGPIVWASGNQMTATMIDMLIENNVVSEFHLNEKAMIINQVDSIRFNQIKGRNMTGYIDSNELHLVDVNGNGESIYFYEENTEIMLNKAISSFIKIYIHERKIQDIEFIQDIEGTLTPFFMIKPEDLYLKDFVWHIDRKPKKKEDIFIK